jgi:pimeloyl-ACP methyl ester carboxylesterase
MAVANPWFLRFILLAAISPLAVARAQEPSSSGDEAVKIVGSETIEVKENGQAGLLPYFSSGRVAEKNPAVQFVLIVFHGAKRNADDYLAAGVAAKEAAPISDGILVLAPQFLNTTDFSTYRLANEMLRWKGVEWEGGFPAEGPAAMSSFSAIDGLLRRLADRNGFPNLKHVVLAGHSGGAQLVQRYAVVGKADEILKPAGIAVRYIVANPSSYLYFDEQRPGSDGKFEKYEAAKCPGFNDWKFGWLKAPSYVSNQTQPQLEESFVLKDLIYLLGTADTDPNHPALDKSCPAEAQGPTRFARGMAYFTYLKMRHPALNQRLEQVPGIGHDGKAMFTSAVGLKALFQ